ncbi:PAS domain S-box protein, partial [Chloroflexota bacterium]
MKDKDKTKEQLIKELDQLRQQNAELEASKADESYIQLLEDMNDAYVVVQDGKYVFANRRFSEMIGYEPEKVIGLPAFRIEQSLDRQTLLDIYEKVISGERLPPELLETVVTKRDGTQIIVEVKFRVIQYEGKPALYAIIGDITERKQTEEKYKQLFEHINDGYGVIQEGKYIFANARLAEIFGYEPGQVIGKSIDDLVGPDDRQAAIEQYERVIHGEEAIPERHEVAVTKRDGTRGVIETNVKAIQYEGKPAFRIVIRDITEREQAEEKYRQLVEDMNDGYGVIQEGKYVFVNRRLAEIFKYEPEQILGKSILEFMTPESRQEKMERYRESTSGERPYDNQHEGETIRGDGVRIVCETSSRPIEYMGKPAISVIVRDITERKQAEEELRESEERFLIAFHQNPTAMAIVELPEGRYIDVNDSYLRMVEYTHEEIIGHTSADFNLFREQVERGRVLQEILANREVEERELIIQTKTGKLLSVRVWSRKVTIGGQPHIISMALDVTERKKAEEKYRQLLEDMDDGCVVIQEGTYVYANSRFGE